MNIRLARSALRLPCLIAASISLASDETPLTPSSPDCLLTRLLNCAVERCSLSMMKVAAPRSRSPALVPMTSPSTGVSPMDVSIDCPNLTAAHDPPLPICAVTIFCFLGSSLRKSQTRWLTYRCDVPWNPYLRIAYFS